MRLICASRSCERPAPGQKGFELLAVVSWKLGCDGTVLLLRVPGLLQDMVDC